MKELIVGLLLCSIGSTTEAANSLPDWAKDAAQKLDQLKYDDADAVVLLDGWKLEVGKSDRTATRQWVVAVLTEKGAAQAMLPLVRNQFTRIRGIKAWSREANGRVTRFDESDGTLWSAMDSKLFADSAVLLLHASRATPGTIFAVTYDVTFDGAIPQDIFEVQGDAPVALFRLQVRARGESTAQVRVGRAPNPGPSQLQDEATWEFRDLPPIEVTSDAYAAKPPRVRLALNYAHSGSAPMSDWSSVARWANDLFRTASQRAVKFNALAATVKGAPSAFEAAGHAARSVRYFGIELGWGSWVPRAPEVTLSRGFGDCKDKALLMVDLLRAAGGEAVPVLISSPSHEFVDPDLPTPFRFNHAIVGVPWSGKKVEPNMVVVDSPGLGPLRLFDATLPDDSSQDLSFLHNGAIGLAVDPRTTGVLRVPDGDADSNRWDTRCLWSWDAAKGVNADCTRTVTGTARVWLESEQDNRPTDKQVEQVTHEDLYRDCPSFSGVQIDPLQTASSEGWHYNFRYECPGALSRFGSTTLMHLPELAPLDYFPLPGLTKAEAVFQPYLRSRTVETSVANAAGVSQTPAPFTVTNPLGSVAVAIATSDDRLVITRTVKTTQRVITKSDAAAAKELRAALARANAVAVVLK